MANEYDPNQVLDYEAELNAMQPPTRRLGVGEDWSRDDTRYDNCVAVWRHGSGDELIVYRRAAAGPDEDRYQVVMKSAASGALRPVQPFPSSEQAEAFVEGMLVNLGE
ncbi:hypothetical protein [Halorarum salinum]|uniref:Uncharacterized protein n=1 Tax=Halorarum salinum TaxID=2743089 RepID=A0A7D5QB41_9EURY|nr:hypothetical protein [Halobaculum salinum]QLG61959.1 hypothetical protein HUG12_09600 [Halobaculum salinum]